MSIVAWLLTYLCAVSLAMALIVLPGVRRRVFDWAQRYASAGWLVMNGSTRRMGALGSESVRHAAASTRGAQQWVTRRWRLVSVLALALALPPVIAWWLGSGRMLEGYEDAARVDPHVAALLQGEQLVPPPPLPPEVFTTREIQNERPLIAEASREWALLDADFRQRLLLVFKIMRERHGYEMALIEGYRSPQRQELLRLKGPEVTHAGAFQSYHQFGLAADCAFYRAGKLVISEQDAWAMQGYRLYGQVAEEVGLVWGGRWKSIIDLGHVELRRPGVLQATTQHRD